MYVSLLADGGAVEIKEMSSADRRGNVIQGHDWWVIGG